MEIGPDVNPRAFKAELSAMLSTLMRTKPSADVLDAAVREVCERHGVKAGTTLDTGKLAEPLGSIITYGAAAARVHVAHDAAGRSFVADGRWLLYTSEAQHDELLAAGASGHRFAETGGDGPVAPYFERLDGAPKPLDVKPTALAMLERFGIGGRGIEQTKDGVTNRHTIDLDGVSFAADAIAVLAVAGAVALVVDRATRMVEGRNAAGDTVGYAMGMAADRAAMN